MIRLVTISRISKEKGFLRMLKMETILKQRGVNFIWDCYGDTTTNHAKNIIPKFKNVNFKGVTHKPKEVVKEYDYLVQLSDTEGFPYSIYEAMQQMIPVIATDFPSIHEMIEKGVNGYILKKDLSNLDINKINNPPVINSFKEKSTEKDWINFLNMARPRKTIATTNKVNDPIAVKPVEVHTKEFTPQQVTVKVIRKYYDMQQDNKLMQEGKKFTVNSDRAQQLVKAKVAEVIEA
jgi:glycosyltransferase involved in cell wall biosynthesis